jgi:hypothetical protein
VGVSLVPLCNSIYLQRETEEKARQPETKLGAIAQTRHKARLRNAKLNQTPQTHRRGAKKAPQRDGRKSYSALYSTTQHVRGKPTQIMTKPSREPPTHSRNYPRQHSTTSVEGRDCPRTWAGPHAAVAACKPRRHRSVGGCEFLSPCSACLCGAGLVLPRFGCGSGFLALASVYAWRWLRAGFVLFCVGFPRAGVHAA